MPLRWRAATVCSAPSLVLSVTARTPTTPDPRPCPSPMRAEAWVLTSPTMTAVLPWLSRGRMRAQASRGTSRPSSCMSRGDPTMTRPPRWVFPDTPNPGCAAKSCTDSRTRPRDWAAATMARPTGCSLCCSTAAARARSWESVRRDPWRGAESLRVGLPFVRVPVLSKTRMETWWATSRASPPLMRMPFSAPTPVPTMTAVGVARPKAQGQATTTTEMAKRSEARKGEDASVKLSTQAPEPNRNTRSHPMSVQVAPSRTRGTNIPATRSAKS
mmetsp:Transcript_20045/g.58585  ORF Transcript_20045/g.58585 Transcript_20045/m.58585 type:complete len:272 (-) Transcript_20045:1253-2068(-)